MQLSVCFDFLFRFRFVYVCLIFRLSGIGKARTSRFSGFRTPARLLLRKRRDAGEEYAGTAGWALKNRTQVAKSIFAYRCPHAIYASHHWMCDRGTSMERVCD